MRDVRRLAIVLLAIAIFAVPITVLAGHTFDDVDDANVFHDDITWLADAGVTLGCNPPDNTEFCPKDNLSREQMSAFMRRFAKFLGAEDGVVSDADHAATADEATNADNATSADNATNADNANTLQGKNRFDFQPALFGFAHNDFVSVNANATFEIAEASVTTTPAGPCIIGQSPQSDILVRATGYTIGVGAGEIATLRLADDGVANLDTSRTVAESDGSFAMEWLFTGDGGDETYSLEAIEGGGDVFGVYDAQITVEVVQDTRCEGLIIIFPLGDGESPSPDNETG